MGLIICRCAFPLLYTSNFPDRQASSSSSSTNFIATQVLQKLQGRWAEHCQKYIRGLIIGFSWKWHSDISPIPFVIFTRVKSPKFGRDFQPQLPLSRAIVLKWINILVTGHLKQIRRVPIISLHAAYAWYSLVHSTQSGNAPLNYWRFNQFSWPVLGEDISVAAPAFSELEEWPISNSGRRQVIYLQFQLQSLF